MARREYRPRIVDKLLVEALEASGAVWIQGPKWCGKTWTALQASKSSLMMQDPDESANYLQQAAVKPSLLLAGESPRLLDEWQTAPVLWDAVRFAVDKRGEAGQFILTGSTMPLRSEVMHSGTGRISRLRMRTMSLFESGESNGRVSLRSLFDGAEPEGPSTLSIEELAFAVARGGWPSGIGAPDRASLSQASRYLTAIVESDVSELSGALRNPQKIGLLMRSIARNVATMATLETLRKDVAGRESDLAVHTVQSYLDVLERLFVIENQPAWNVHLRSSAYLRKSPKRHFVDPSIAVAALRTNPEGLLRDFNTFGYLFESLCVRDLRIYAQGLGGEICHYHDESGLEADAIVSLPDGRWGAIEVKMGQRQVDEASTNLLELKDRVDADLMKPPSFLMVLTANGYALKQKNGVLVVPIGCLKD
jgi:predicted AAA+ superfamily ATPase